MMFFQRMWILMLLLTATLEQSGQKAACNQTAVQPSLFLVEVIWLHWKPLIRLYSLWLPLCLSVVLHSWSVQRHDLITALWAETGEVGENLNVHWRTAPYTQLSLFIAQGWQRQWEGNRTLKYSHDLLCSSCSEQTWEIHRDNITLTALMKNG